eukprot:CAMPEP_0115152866 /NCGR_PEP_ID=MMETSP0227-20121206/66397_1 /TAXON_ID=89957 /ORGANISM="Polarella glacialis, Strain CCMP 1383" /LENGTH=158 /DNA_ID=CAMNT_0002563519 /DNA_START=99 /DNA_END=575 /DNA_ORIENTATION=-
MGGSATCSSQVPHQAFFSPPGLAHRRVSARPMAGHVSDDFCFLSSTTTTTSRSLSYSFGCAGSASILSFRGAASAAAAAYGEELKGQLPRWYQEDQALWADEAYLMSTFRAGGVYEDGISEDGSHMDWSDDESTRAPSHASESIGWDVESVESALANA